GTGGRAGGGRAGSGRPLLLRGRLRRRVDAHGGGGGDRRRGRSGGPGPGRRLVCRLARERDRLDLDEATRGKPRGDGGTRGRHATDVAPVHLVHRRDVVEGREVDGGL